jgi:hypothetical protein
MIEKAIFASGNAEIEQIEDAVRKNPHLSRYKYVRFENPIILSVRYFIAQTGLDLSSQDVADRIMRFEPRDLESEHLQYDRVCEQLRCDFQGWFSTMHLNHRYKQKFASDVDK